MNDWAIKQPHLLFITYIGALEPLIQSLGIPYLKRLTEKGIKVSILSFEKTEYRQAGGKFIVPIPKPRLV